MRIEPGNCLEVMRRLAEEGVRVDAIVTDPPYHLTSGGNGGGFMGKAWDGGDVAFNPVTWGTAAELLKPGGYLLAFGGTRNYHRLGWAIEGGGFEIRDMIQWNYATGFPKGLNVVNNLNNLAICQSKNNVRVAAQCSTPIRVVSPEAKTPIAVALVQTLPEGGLALLTEIGGEVALHVPTDTWPSEWMAIIGLSIAWSWNESLADACKSTNKCITATMSETTTDQRTWNWLQSLHTSATIILHNATLPSGLPWPAVFAASNSNGSSASRESILIVSALGDATWNPVVNFEGFNVALKPAVEPICVARKPLSEKTVASNVLKHGTGALNVDGCRIGTDNPRRSMTGGMGRKANPVYGSFARTEVEEIETNQGRWPANVCHDGSPEVEAAFAAFGDRSSPRANGNPNEPKRGRNHIFPNYGQTKNSSSTDRRDTGTASRFFYTAKADKHDRWGSKHPTVKPIDLMRWLVRLVTPPGGTVLDPFAGSGTTGIAAMAEGFDCILIEREDEYLADIRERLAFYEGGGRHSLAAKNRKREKGHDDLPLFSGLTGQ